MLESNLSKALCAFVSEATQDFRLETKNGELKAPQIIEGYLPPKRAKNDDDDVPFVIVRFDDSTSELGQTAVTMSIVIGCYTLETDGYLYCLQVFECLRRALCEMPHQTLDERYQLAFPIECKNIDEHPYPYWQLEMTTHWVFNTPQLFDF